MHISNSSTIHLARNLFGTRFPPFSLFFHGLPLTRGILYWGDRASNFLPYFSSPSTPGFAWCYIIVSAGKGKTPFLSLGMLVVSENKYHSLWGSGWVIFLLWMPFIMFWEVSMKQPIFILCAVDTTNAQGKKFDQPGLARKITNSAWIWFRE